MPDEKLSLPELTALVVLMREAREVSNPELEKAYGLTLTGTPRKRLNAMKLVESHKRGRAYGHVLTEAGWARLGEELRVGVARPAGSAGALAYVLAQGLQQLMQRTGHVLADVFAPAGDLAPAGPPVPSPPASPEQDVQARIRAAYAEIGGRPGAYVGLTELRRRLGEVPRAEVDRALRAMNRLPDVNIVPESNQKTLTPEDREAAVTIGDQEKHVLWIGA
ncbi:hypothetical protein [Sphaerisporangium fuscum]|uniref:hypothetical protein n=1 Tax=Sphaerisporangium fuscum TaxID=2835868 RepID=UPI001BDC24BC|nr:hypothetical protein [Sphaerisporangium fuscum]